jgi:quercetin dioxygenase-like cupin family protein
MNTSKVSEVTPIAVKPGCKRRIIHTDHLMMVAIDFSGGPAENPDPPHTHPHEQVTYVAAGEVNFFIGEEFSRLAAGDMVAVPPNLPHRIQLLTPTACLIDTFTPIRQDFL